MTGNTSVRAIEQGDLEAWLPLWQGYNAFYGREGATALAPEITETTWARFFDPSEPVHGLVADTDGTLVGLAHYLFHRSTTAIALSCYMQDLFVDNAVRGQGVGRALIDGVADRARSAGSNRLYWLTHETNAPARSLYDAVATHAGFIVYAKVV